MTKFEQLRVEVTKRIESEKTYWESLHKVAKNFGAEFSEYLGMESNEALDLDSNKIGIIKVGRIKDGKFEQCAYWQYDKDGRDLSFILFMQLPGQNSMQSELSLSLKIIARKPDINGTSLNIRTASMLYDVACEEINGQVNLNPFFDALYKEIQSKIDVQSL
jgi:hypothetical protein